MLTFQPGTYHELLYALKKVQQMHFTLHLRERMKLMLLRYGLMS